MCLKVTGDGIAPVRHIRCEKVHCRDDVVISTGSATRARIAIDSEGWSQWFRSSGNFRKKPEEKKKKDTLRISNGRIVTILQVSLPSNIDVQKGQHRNLHIRTRVSGGFQFSGASSALKLDITLWIISSKSNELPVRRESPEVLRHFRDRVTFPFSKDS